MAASDGAPGTNHSPAADSGECDRVAAGRGLFISEPGNAAPEDALGELSLEVNALADMLSAEKVRTIEATALLQRVVDEIDAPLFTFDPSLALRLVNPAGEHLLRQTKNQLLGRNAAGLGLQECLTADNETVVELNVGESRVRWLLRRSSFRQRGYRIL